MVSLKTFLFTALIAAPALAAPAAELEIEARDVIYRCPHGKISQNKAIGNMHQAPVTLKGTGSGYPHEFKNYPHYKWANKKCNTGSGKGGQHPPTLLEFPVFEDGHFYNYNKGHPKPDDGYNRVIYSYPNKEFCGIIGHTDKGKKGDKLVQCQ
ncbi:clavin precursor [Pyronema domesticum]|nr:clavin precursor [Pyronema domesticum]